MDKAFSALKFILAEQGSRISPSTLDDVLLLKSCSVPWAIPPHGAFHPDSFILYCGDKSALVRIFNNLPFDKHKHFVFFLNFGFEFSL